MQSQANLKLFFVYSILVMDIHLESVFSAFFFQFSYEIKAKWTDWRLKENHKAENNGLYEEMPLLKSEIYVFNIDFSSEWNAHYWTKSNISVENCAQHCCGVRTSMEHIGLIKKVLRKFNPRNLFKLLLIERWLRGSAQPITKSVTQCFFFFSEYSQEHSLIAMYW